MRSPGTLISPYRQYDPGFDQNDTAEAPNQIIVAVPVAPVETAHKMRKYVNEFICLHEVEDFEGVGYYYTDFSDVSDKDAISRLREANGLCAVAQNKRAQTY
jgi:predicted phosphoribosyltransferase